MQPEVQLFFRGLRRWWYVAALVPILIGVLAWGYSSRQTPMYSASVTLQVNVNSVNASGAYDQLMFEGQMAKVFQTLVIQHPVMKLVVESLALELAPEELALHVTTRYNEDSQLITVDVSDSSPQRAADIANAIAPALETYMQQYTQQGNTNFSAELSPVITTLNTQISDLQSEITTLRNSVDEGTPLPATLAFLESQLDDLQALQANLLSLARESEPATVISIAPAQVPSNPYSPQPVLTAALGVLAGLVIASGLVLVLVYLDNTVKSSLDFQSLIGGPMLSSVARIQKLAEGRQQLYVIDKPNSAAAEAIRMLRTNIEFASSVDEIATLAVTSPAPSDGKSTIAANLAVALSQAGFVTALVDSDLRRPEQHKIFQVRNDRGLSTVLSRTDVQWHQVAVETGLQNLVVIPSGPIPPNAADLVSLPRLGEMLTDMRRLFDIVIIDTPPVLAVSDAMAVAGHTDGMVLVCRAGRTRIDALRNAAETLQRSAVRVVGVVLNQDKAPEETSYYSSEFKNSGLRRMTKRPSRGIVSKLKIGKALPANSVVTEY